MELQGRAHCAWKGLLGSCALLPQLPTDSKGLWDEALNCNSPSSHASPLCCPDTMKRSYRILLGPEASSSPALRAQTWGAALCRAQPLGKPISCASPVGAVGKGKATGQGTAGGSGGWPGATLCPGAAASLQQRCELLASCFSASTSFRSACDFLATRLPPTL